jgi:hypothetical protein
MLKVSEDLLCVLKGLLEFLLSSPSFLFVEEMFTLDREGYSNNFFLAHRVLEIDYLPEYMWENPPVNIIQNEIWVINNKHDSEGGVPLIEGDELRYLVKEGKRLWTEIYDRESFSVEEWARKNL